MPPAVSVVLCVFNGLPYLQESVRSVLGQTHQDLELIVVDDGSTDGSWKVLAELASQDPRLILKRNAANLGLTLSLNRGLRLARGRLLARQDADDVSRPDRLERQVAFLRDHPAVGLVGALPVFIDEAGVELEARAFPVLADNARIQRQLLDSNCLVAGSVMIRRECLDRVGEFNPQFAFAQDYDLWLRLAEVTQLANLPGGLYRYRVLPTALSQRHRAGQMRYKALAVEGAMERRFGENPPRTARELAARDHLRAAYLGFVQGEGELARLSLDRAAHHLPRVWSRGALVERVFTRYLTRLPVEESYRTVEALFEELLPKTPHLARVKRRLLSRLRIRDVFAVLGQGPDGVIGDQLRLALRDDPRWLFNRGVLSIVLKRPLSRFLRPRVL
jgi:glycosyltransferase involved in cell wall biosynthesis